MAAKESNNRVSPSTGEGFVFGPDATVAVVGAGYIGSVLAAVLADRGVNVLALDSNKSIVEKISAGLSPVREPGLDELVRTSVASGKLNASTDLSRVRDASVILITVGTPLDDDNNPDISGIEKLVSALSPYVEDGQLVILKSTVPPYTTETKVAEPLRQHADVMVAFCPERLSEGNAIDECQKIPVVVGGVDARSTDAAIGFWRSIFEVDIVPLESARAAELVKLADNAWIDLNIAIAFELAKLADHMDVDVLPVISAANSLPKGDYNVNILTPSVGVGGHCLTKDPWFLNSFSRKFGAEFSTAVTSRRVNDSAPLYSARKFQRRLSEKFSHIDPRDITVAVLGLSFKNNTGDCRFSPAIPFIDYLSSSGLRVRAFDPWVAEGERCLFPDITHCQDMSETLEQAHGVAFLSGHSTFHEITTMLLSEKLQNGAVIFDGRMFFSRERIEEFKGKGFDYLGVGR
jgi:nucleotide sugar dehydrogenase